MIERILVPLDGSPLAEAALPTAEELARRLDAEAYFVEILEAVLPVVPIEPTIGGAMDPQLVTQQMEADADAAEAYLGRVVGEWRQKGLKARWFVLRGSPATSLVDFVHANHIDLVAMGTHGRSGLSRLVFGSVASSVVQHAGVPVLLVRGAETGPMGGSAGKKGHAGQG
ncbi:MAG: universal stress protein [Chloroflexota bacterium]